MSSTFDKVVSLLNGAIERSGGEVSAFCPAHDDQRRSLSVTEKEGMVLIHCHAGCRTEAIVEKIGLTMADLSPSSKRGRKKAPIIAEAYEYRDERGELLYQVVRYEPKAFLQRRPDGNGGWKWNLGDVRRVLYRLPEVVKGIRNGDFVFVVEGEKDADTLRGLGLVATCNPGGAGKWRDDMSQALRGAKVVVLADNDDAGRRHAQKVVESLRGTSESVEELRLPDLPERGDVSDWVAAGGTADDLLRLVSNLEPQTQSFGVRLCNVTARSCQWLWPGYIPQGKLALLDGDPGTGKSWFCLDLAARVSAGLPMPFCDEARDPAGVLILAGEDDPRDTVRPRLLAAGGDPVRVFLPGVDPSTGIWAGGSPLQGNLEPLRRAILEMHARLIIVDPLMGFLPSNVDSHKDQDVRRVLQPLSALAAQTGATILVVRHLNKSCGTHALYRGGGTIGIIGAARVAHLLGLHPEDPNRRVLAPIKSNVGPLSRSLTFRIEGSGETACVAWEGPSELDAQALLAGHEAHRDACQLYRAEGLLLGLLADGPIAATEVYAKAERVGIHQRTLQEAKRNVGAVSRRVGFGKGSASSWLLPYLSGVLEAAAARTSHIVRKQGAVASYGEEAGNLSSDEWQADDDAA
ncbi:MAG: AAA family ATPase [Actinobacteria bacterium]|nr:AAA family ATPase [Actinomycetota bacterium]